MSVFRCESCGAALDIQEGTKIAFCPYCGTKQTLQLETRQILGDGTTIDSLTKRGYMLLEEGEFAKADEYFDRVLEIEPENGRAYMGKLMACIDACDKFDLEEQLRHMDDNPDKWETFGKAYTLLNRMKAFAPDEFRDMFSSDYDEAVELMNKGDYEAAANIFMGIEKFYPEALGMANRCFVRLGMTRKEFISQESEERSKAINVLIQETSKANDLWIKDFGGMPDEEMLDFIRDEICRIVDTSITAFEKLGDLKRVTLFKPDYWYRTFTSSVKWLTDYISPSFIKFRKADRARIDKYLNDVFNKLNEMCTYIEQHDIYDAPGTQEASSREEFRKKLNEFRDNPVTFHAEKNERKKPSPYWGILKACIVLYILYEIIKRLS